MYPALTEDAVQRAREEALAAPDADGLPSTGQRRWYLLHAPDKVISANVALSRYLHGTLEAVAVPGWEPGRWEVATTLPAK